MANIVQYISYRDEKWPVRISYYALKKFQEETGKDIDALDNDITLLEVLLWYALIAGHQAEKKPMTLKREDVEFMLDESLDEFNLAMMSFFPTASGEVSTDKKK